MSALSFFPKNGWMPMPLFLDQLVAVIPADHPLARGEPVELCESPFIMKIVGDGMSAAEKTSPPQICDPSSLIATPRSSPSSNR